MQRLLLLITAFSVSVGSIATNSFGRKSPAPTPTVDANERPLAQIVGNSAHPRFMPFAVETTLVDSWDFEDGLGGPDPQGWTTYDRTAQIDTFFHVDDFSLLGGGSFGRLTPIEGAQSLWCGARPCASADDICSYASLPGYGNNWNQRFQSAPFNVTGDVTINFRIRYDSESFYDYTHVEYTNGAGPWQSLAQFTGIGDSLITRTVPVGNHSGTLSFRFRFQSEGAWSDEDGFKNTDGAAIIDLLTVSDASGVVDSQDFESESVGALATSDGQWQASGMPAYGDFTGLFDGNSVLQEDPAVTNASHLWGFFNGSPDTYECGGHPEQPAVPFTYSVDGVPLYIRNEIRSPAVSLSGTPATPILLGFDVYRDLPRPNIVFYEFRVRSQVAGAWKPWRSNDFVYYGDFKDWYAFVRDISELIDTGATHVQIGIGVYDVCFYWCGVYGDGSCHSHAPLIDNVRVMSVNQSFLVTNTANSGAGSLRQAIIDANASAVSSVVQFAIPGAGAHGIELTTGLPAITVPIVVDGTSQPGYAGTPLIYISGPPGLPFQHGLVINAGNSAVLGLQLSGFGFESGGIAIDLNSSNNVVQGCAIYSSDFAIAIDGSNNTIGGILPGEANTIIGNGAKGVLVNSGTGNSIRGNSINNDAFPAQIGFGIDLAPGGVTPNDVLDTDSGANNLQNFPVLDYLDTTGGIVHGRLQSTPNTTFDIDFYHGSACDPTGYGEGETYVGSTQVTTSAQGFVSFAASLGAIPPLNTVTATATDPTGNTSEFSACRAGAPLLVVTSAASSGPGTLAEAVTLSNASPGLDVITFNIPGSGWHIVGSTGPKSFTGPVVIDGYTQPGTSPNTQPINQACDAVIRILVNGGVHLLGGGSLVRGISTRYIALTSDGNRVEGSFIGTDGAGSFNTSGDGVQVTGSQNVIGGLDPEDRNVIAGHTSNEVHLNGPTAVQNVVQGNFIGTGATGTEPLGDTGNTYGVSVRGDNNLIGGDVEQARNVIVTIEYGVQVANSDGNTIAGNYFGLTPSGTPVALPFITQNASIGLFSSNNNVVGGTSFAERNVCANAGYGIYLSSANDNTIHGNYVGTDGSGTVQVGITNGLIATSSNNNWIGGTSPGEGNLFAGSWLDAMEISSGTGNRILGNSIRNSGVHPDQVVVGLGINLSPGGVTANDAGDVDTGANNLQNFPVLTSAVTGGGTTTVAASLSSAASTSFRLEFFSNSSCNTSGYGEGQTYLGAAYVSTDESGVGTINAILPVAVAVASTLTATATDPAGNTSEFSACIAAINTPTGDNVAVQPVDETTGTSPLTLTFDEISAGGITTLTTGPVGPPLPGTFVGGSDIYYNLSTTATFSGNIEVCINYDEGALQVPEGSLQLLHWDTAAEPDAWVDITSSLDVNTNTLCGITDHLSPFAFGVGSVTAVDDTPAPRAFALYQNAPNPFNPTTTIFYDVPTGGAKVTLRIYDVSGRVVRTLVDGQRPSGNHRALWDGRNSSGESVASGVYFYRMAAGSFVEARRMVLLK